MPPSAPSAWLLPIAKAARGESGTQELASMATSGTFRAQEAERAGGMVRAATNGNKQTVEWLNSLMVGSLPKIASRCASKLLSPYLPITFPSAETAARRFTPPTSAGNKNAEPSDLRVVSELDRMPF
mmetsp:Transcript_14095/g.23396  ORF Transcript_14095/g.23396 Transcript_14095/m.23396 type:complete len:127 (-) Transcript_14095:309-689(-)